MQGRKNSDMQFQQALEDMLTLAERAQSAALQPGPLIEKQHQPSHQPGSQCEPPVLAFISFKISALHALGQHHGLTECQA
jgi:hypothetical protein